VRQTRIPCTLMRGGTSKGPFFLASDLPPDPEQRDRVLLALMGSPDARQIDGLGGADSLTSKVAVVGPSSRPDADVDYLFLQVVVDEPRVDASQNCGNMLAGIGPFAIEKGAGCRRRRRDEGAHPHGQQRQHRGGARADAGRRGALRRGRADRRRPGTAAPIVIDFLDIAGSSTAARCSRPATRGTSSKGSKRR